ncbi:Propetide, peptidase C25 domain protein, partial [Candidatus Thiomargarita nelsonii]
EIYQSNSEQPASPVKIGMIGYLGEQRVAQIQFFPVLHNPVQQTIKLYKRLRVRVSFSNDTRSAPVMEESSPFDKMLDSLLINPATRQRRTRTVRDTACPSPLPALKISIDKTGVYAISYADFLALGLDLSVLDAQQIHMSHQGEPVSIFIAGVEDGVFGPGDALFFYAQAATGLYTRNNVYWLSLNPDGGARLNFKEGTPAPSLPQLTDFTQTVHVENNNLYSSRMPDSTNRDHLFWKQVGAGDSLDMPVTLHHVAQTSGNATVRVMLQGKTN